MNQKNFFYFAAIMALTSLFHAQAVSEYLFHQQLGDGCRVIPSLNRYKLVELIKNYGSPNASDIITKSPWYEWHTRRDYLGINFDPYYRWISSFSELQANPSNYPDLYNFLVNAAKEGPVMPHFYDKNGDFFLSEENKNDPKLSKQDKAQITLSNLIYGPSFFIDYAGTRYSQEIHTLLKQTEWKIDIESTLPDIYFRIPFGKEKDGSFKLFNKATNTYDQVQVNNLPSQPSGCGYEYPINLAKQVELPETKGLWVTRFKNYQNLHRIGQLFMKQPSKYDEKKQACVPNYPLGFTEIGQLNYLPLTLQLNVNEAYGSGKNLLGKMTGKTTFAPDAQGRTKLFFLRLGIDEINNSITSAHGLYKAYIDLAKICNTTPEHPWSDRYCNKDYFLQYQVAQIFNDNPELSNEMNNVLFNILDCDPQNTWWDYLNLLSYIGEEKLYRDKKGTLYTYENTAPYLMGYNQMLAYATTMLARFIWVGCIDTKEFTEYASHEFNDFIKTNMTQRTEKNQPSFIEVWKKIVAKLKATGEEHFISQEAHGWTATFNDSLVNAQVNKLSNAIHKKLLKDLGFINIESMYEKEFKDITVRDQKISPTLGTLQKQRSRIMLAESLATLQDKKLLPKLAPLRQASNNSKVLNPQQLITLSELEKQLKTKKETFEKETKEKIDLWYETSKALDSLAQALNDLNITT